MRRHWTIGLVAVAVAAAACGRNDDRADRRRPDAGTHAVNGTEAPGTKPAAAAGSPRIVFLGDSLTAGLGLPAEQSYPSRIQQRLNKEGLAFETVNAGVSGDTSAGGLSRLDWALDGDVKVLVLALGGNDGLRGLPVDQLKANLAQMIERAQARGIRVVLAGMEAPPNYGRDYIVAFHKVYPALAQQYHVALMPFLLQDVAGSQTLNQPDGIHPTAEGARIVADHLWAVLKPVLDDVAPERSRSASEH
jgi:acyl-CoA thioesterase I